MAHWTNIRDACQFDETQSGGPVLSIELQMLVYSTGLLILLVLVQTLVGVQSAGLMPLAGARDGLPPPKPFHARMLRVVDNHREGLLMFAPLVLALAAAQVSNQWTQLGAQLFFYARVVHAVLYVVGVPMVRPLAWGVGLGGTLLMLLAALRII